jgi:hypothetical protein
VTHLYGTFLGNDGRDFVATQYEGSTYNGGPRWDVLDVQVCLGGDKFSVERTRAGIG